MRTHRHVMCVGVIAFGLTACTDEEQQPLPRASVAEIAHVGGGRYQIMFAIENHRPELKISARFKLRKGVIVTEQVLDDVGATVTVMTEPLALAAVYHVQGIFTINVPPNNLLAEGDLITELPTVSRFEPAVGGDLSQIAIDMPGLRPDTTVAVAIRRETGSPEVVHSLIEGACTATGCTGRMPLILATDPELPLTFAAQLQPARVFVTGTIDPSGDMYTADAGTFTYSYLFNLPEVASGAAGSMITLQLFYSRRDVSTLEVRLGTAPMTLASEQEGFDISIGGAIFFTRATYQVPAIAPGDYDLSVTTRFGEPFRTLRSPRFTVTP